MKAFNCKFLIILLVLIASNLSGQGNQPVITCADVNADGSVVLTWDDPTSSPTEVFRNEGSGFVSIGAFIDNTFIDTQVDANQGSIAYYVLNQNDQNSPSDTVYTIFLELIPGLETQVDTLLWNFPFLPPSSEGDFTLERSMDGGPFETLGVLDANVNTYLDTLVGYIDDSGSLVGFCDEENSDTSSFNFNYRVIYQAGDCSMSSQVLSRDYTDEYAPPLPVIETISVNPENDNVLLYWNPSAAPDLLEYVVQEIDEFNNYIERGRIPAEDPTEFVDPDLNPGSGPVTLAIRAEDFCDNDLSIRTATTMLAEASLDTCELLVNMNWTPYEDWEEGVSAYEIRALVDGAEEFLTTVGPELNEVEVQVEPNKEYILFVRAISNGGQRPSNSNGIRMLTEYPKIIEYQYLHSVSTNQQNQIEVNLLQDTTGVGTLYELYRAENEGMFRLIRTFQGSEEEFLTYVDSDVRPGDTEYTYFWRAFDGCGQLIGDSNQGVNIVLTARVNNDQPVVRLNWTPYETWENGVESYNIWRSPGSPDEFELLATVNSDETQFEEDIESFAEEEGRFCYRIEALEAESQFPKASAFSNISCVVQPPIIWVPNAMVYGGFNDEFKPVLSFIEFDSYQMEIYNKWGELLFATNDYQEGWDGTYRGNPVREDYYRYIIKFQDGAGKVTLEEGVLYVLNEGD